MQIVFLFIFVLVAHRVFGVASTINSGNYIYFAAMERTLKLEHPKAMTIFTSLLWIGVVHVVYTCINLY